MPATRLAAAVATAAAAFTLAACGGDDRPSAGAAGADCPEDGVRFGVEPYEAPAKLTPAYTVLAEALSRELGCEVELQIVADYSAEVLAMRNDQLEIAEFGPLGYVFATQKAGAEPVASFGVAGGELSSYTAGIWVAKDSPVQAIEDLRGKSLALSEPGSTSGDAMPRMALREAGMEDADVKVDYAGGHPEALLALAKGKVDAAEINSQQLTSAKDAGQFDEADFRRIWTSDPIPNDPVTVRGNLPDAFKQRVEDALLGLAPADVEKVGAFLDVDPPGPMVAVTNDTYQPLFDLAATLGLTEDDV